MSILWAHFLQLLLVVKHEHIGVRPQCAHLLRKNAPSQTGLQQENPMALQHLH